MVVNTIWIGNTFPLLQQMCAISWLKNGHEFNLWAYGLIKDVPNGVHLQDANQVYPHRPLQLYQNNNNFGSPVLHATMFRYAFLVKRGGCFVDCDTMCLKSFDVSRKFVFSSEGKTSQPNLAFVNIPITNSPVMRACFTEAQIKLEIAPVWGHFGPKLLRKKLILHKCMQHVALPIDYCPLNWSEANDIFKPDFDYNRIKNSYTTRLWQQIFTLEGRELDNFTQYPETSFWRKTCELSGDDG